MYFSRFQFFDVLQHLWRCFIFNSLYICRIKDYRIFNYCGQVMVKRGNEKEFEGIYREMYVRLCVYAESIVDDDDVAKDIVQQVFVRLWERVDSIDWTGVQAYLFRCVYNGAMNVIRHERVRHEFMEFLQKQGADEEENNPLFSIHDDREYLIQKVNELITAMPEQMKEIFLLSRFSGKKSAEIAMELNLSVRTVENQLYRAMKYLKEKLNTTNKGNLLLLSFFYKGDM